MLQQIKPAEHQQQEIDHTNSNNYMGQVILNHTNHTLNIIFSLTLGYVLANRNVVSKISSNSFLRSLASEMVLIGRRSVAL